MRGFLQRRRTLTTLKAVVANGPHRTAGSVRVLFLSLILCVIPNAFSLLARCIRLENLLTPQVPICLSKRKWLISGIMATPSARNYGPNPRTVSVGGRNFQPDAGNPDLWATYGDSGQRRINARIRPENT